jgi:hypothetical protein
MNMGLLTQIFAPHLERQSGDVIDSCYGLSAPDTECVKKREDKVRKLKAQMGDKYLLAKPIAKKTSK